MMTEEIEFHQEEFAFLFVAEKLASVNAFITMSMCLMCSAIELDQMTMSSM